MIRFQRYSKHLLSWRVGVVSWGPGDHPFSFEHQPVVSDTTQGLTFAQNLLQHKKFYTKKEGTIDLRSNLGRFLFFGFGLELEERVAK